MGRLGRVPRGAELPRARIWEKQKKTKKKVFKNNLNFELAFSVILTSPPNSSFSTPLGRHFANNLENVMRSEELEYKALYTRTRRMVRKQLANGSQTKCAYMWTRLWTCVAPSMNGLLTVLREQKFVGFLRKNKENSMCQVSFPYTGCHLLALGSQKIN